MDNEAINNLKALKSLKHYQLSIKNYPLIAACIFSTNL